MNTGRTVLAQLFDFISKYEFDKQQAFQDIELQKIKKLSSNQLKMF